MYVYMYICIYMCDMYIYVCTYIQVCNIYICIHTHSSRASTTRSMYRFIYIYIYIHMKICTYACTCTHMFIYTYIAVQRVLHIAAIGTQRIERVLPVVSLNLPVVSLNMYMNIFMYMNTHNLYIFPCIYIHTTYT